MLSHSAVSNSLIPFRLQPARFLCPWSISSKSTGVGCHCLLQRVFSTRGSKLRLLHLLHRQVDSFPLSHLGSPQCKREMGNYKKESEGYARDQKHCCRKTSIRQRECTGSPSFSTPPAPQNLCRVGLEEASVRAVEEVIHSNHTKRSLVLLTRTASSSSTLL